MTTHGAHTGGADTGHVKHYSQYPGAILIPAADLDDDAIIWLGTHPNWPGSSAVTDIASDQDEAFRQRLFEVFNGPVPKLPAGYQPTAQMLAVEPVYTAYLAQRHG